MNKQDKFAVPYMVLCRDDVREFTSMRLTHKTMERISQKLSDNIMQDWKSNLRQAVAEVEENGRE